MKEIIKSSNDYGRNKIKDNYEVVEFTEGAINRLRDTLHKTVKRNSGHIDPITVWKTVNDIESDILGLKLSFDEAQGYERRKDFNSSAETYKRIGFVTRDLANTYTKTPNMTIFREDVQKGQRSLIKDLTMISKLLYIKAAEMYENEANARIDRKKFDTASEPMEEALLCLDSAKKSTRGYLAEPETYKGIERLRERIEIKIKTLPKMIALINTKR